jgi:hypothetical protein
MTQDIVNAAVSQALTSRNVPALIEKLLELPQPRIDVRHIYGHHIYMRELVIPAGMLIVGRRHRTTHGCILVRGRLVFFNDDGTRTEAAAPLEFEAGPGRKIAQALEETVFVNSHLTDETDVDTLDALLYEDPPPPDTREMLTPDGDFERLLEEQGADAAAVRRASEQTADLCPFPHGAYKVKVGRSLIEGRGLIATATIPQGEFICPGTWGNCRTPAGRYTNHARDPNAYFKYDEVGTAWLIAKRPISGSIGAQDGEEITTDYRLSPRKRWEDLS